MTNALDFSHAGSIGRSADLPPDVVEAVNVACANVGTDVEVARWSLDGDGKNADAKSAFANMKPAIRQHAKAHGLGASVRARRSGDIMIGFVTATTDDGAADAGDDAADAGDEW